MILIYTHKITPRLRFVVRHLFRRIMGANAELTDSVDDFVKHAGPKLTYARQPLQSEFFIRSNELLFDRNIEPQDIHWRDWEGAPCFFELDARSSIPFDVFAASFFLLSRYEEYLPHQKDDLGRFRAIESVLSDRQGAMKRPLVDLWALKLKEALVKAFPGIEFKDREYKVNVIITAISAHKFSYRSVSRHVFESFIDLGKLRFTALSARFKTVILGHKDPYDNYLELHQPLSEMGVQLFPFFQYSRYDVNDRNVSWSKSKYGFFLKHINDYLEIGYLRSRLAIEDAGLFKLELKKMQQLLHRPLHKVVLSEHRILLPDAYQELVQEEVKEDFSMGYADVIGFRAGTCTPFPFYDLGLEVEQPLRVYPICTSHEALRPLDVETVEKQLITIANEVKAVKGTFCLQLSNKYIQKMGIHSITRFVKAVV